MADFVIHGIGKPRFILPTAKFFSGNTVASSTSTQVVITELVSPPPKFTGYADLDALNLAVGGLVGMEFWSYNSDDEQTWAVVRSYINGTNTIVIDAWSNGAPEATQSCYVQGRVIDLPYCQRLTERFTPDFIVKKMLNGNIRRIKRGFYYSATLDYGRYLKKADMRVLEYLFTASMNGCGFYPRKDNTSILYDIDIDPESSIEFYQLAKHQGHGGVVINIVGIKRIPKIPFQDPATGITDVITDGAGEYITDDIGEYITEETI